MISSTEKKSALSFLQKNKYMHKYKPPLIHFSKKEAFKMRYPSNETLSNTQCLTPNKSYLRFLHALPNDPPVNVDIFVNNRLLVKNFKFEDFTEYLPARPGVYNIQIFPTGNHIEQLLSIHITLEDGMSYTAAIIGNVNDIGLELFSDYKGELNPDYAYMRFINLSPDTAGVDIFIDKTPVVYDLNFMEATDYLQLSSGKHTMEVYLTSNGERVVSHPNMVLKNGNVYTTYVVGFSKGRPYIEVLIPLEGTSYLKY